MFCIQCGEKLAAGAGYCGACGAAVQAPSGHTVQSPSTPKPAHDQWILSKLAHGAYGLPRTFWLNGVLVWIIYIFAETFLILSKSNTAANFLGFLFIGYLFVLIPGVWNSANQYLGPKIWARLAKLVCAFWIFQLGAVTIRMVEAFYA